MKKINQKVVKSNKHYFEKKLFRLSFSHKRKIVIVRQKIRAYLKKKKFLEGILYGIILGIVGSVVGNFLTDYIKSYPDAIEFSGHVELINHQEFNSEIYLHVEGVGFDTLISKSDRFNFIVDRKKQDVIIFEIKSKDEKNYRLDSVSIDMTNLSDYKILLYEK